MPSLPAVPGSVIVVRGVRLVATPLIRIRPPRRTELIQARLAMLRNGFNRLDEILTNPYWHGDQITLALRNGLYDIVDGRHRVSLALERSAQGLTTVWARHV